LGFWVLGFGVWGLGVGVQNLGFGDWSLGFGVRVLGFDVWCFEVWGLGVTRTILSPPGAPHRLGSLLVVYDLPLSSEYGTYKTVKARF